jgi:hypothetical protein
MYLESIFQKEEECKEDSEGILLYSVKCNSHFMLQKSFSKAACYFQKL